MDERVESEGGQPLRVLQVHNSYQQRGGEDAVFEAEHDLLVAAGHEVERFHLHNRAITTGRWDNVRLGLRSIWSRSSYRAIRAMVRRFRPDVAHVHNTMPLISPAVYRALSREGVPVVQTVHNYRLLCPAGTLFRDGAPCEDCVGRNPMPALRHRCYKNSRAASAAVVATLMTHRALGTYARHVDRFLALTEFGRGKLIEGGLPAERIAVVPNFLGNDPGPLDLPCDRDGVLFVGRLAEEKGVRVLLDAIARLPADLPVRIIGTGPLVGEVRATAASCEQVEYLGAVAPGEVGAWMQRSAALVLPSIWYEGLPMTLIEAWQNGLPVVASGIGSLRELVDGEVGTRFRAGDAAHLALRLRSLLGNSDRLAAQGRAARARYERDFVPARHLEQLVGVYREVMVGAVGQEDSLPAGEGSRTGALASQLDKVPAIFGSDGGKGARREAASPDCEPSGR